MEKTWWTQPEQLDDDQKAIVALGDDEDHVILGPPGSGKTNLLVLRAAHLHASGYRNLAVLTFGRVLREFLASGTENYEFPHQRIQTYHRWGAELLGRNGIKVQGSFEQIRSQLLQGLAEVASRASAENTFDCILLDEAQDYAPSEIQAIRQFGARLFAVGDDRQRIYKNNGSIDLLESSVRSIKRLKFHYRNGIKICRAADGIRNEVNTIDNFESNSQYDEVSYPSSVSSFAGCSIRQQVEIAVPEIQTQLRAYPDELIGILCPLLAQLDEIWALLVSGPLGKEVQLQRHSQGYEAFNSDRRVIVTTIHGAKGLEFRALHLLGMDKITKFTDRAMNLAYTAVTRSKTSLAIYHQDALPGYLEKGVDWANGNMPDVPKLDQLFKPKR